MPRPYNIAFIDGANLHFTYEESPWQVDYQKLRIYLKKKLNVNVAYYFIGETKQYKDIYTKLETYDYTIKLKTPSPYKDEAEYCPHCAKLITPEIQRYKSDVDSYMTLQILLDIDVFDKAILITSDGDFDVLAKRLFQRDKLGMVFAPCKDKCSWLLRSASRGRIDFIDAHKNELEKH